jgi:hypothetical protein
VYAPNPVKADAVELVDDDGTKYRGAEAIFRALRLTGIYRCAPRRLETAYRFVAGHRGAFGRFL